MRETLKEILKKKKYYLYLVPSFVLLITFSYYPVASAIYHSFFQWDGVNAVFVGMQNYVQMVQDEILCASVGNMVALTIFGLVTGLTIPLLVAELIVSLRDLKHQRLYRLAFLIPMVVPGIVILLMWQFIYDPNVGLLNRILSFMSGREWKQNWLGDVSTALYSLMGMGFPWAAGINVLIFLSGLGSIDLSLYDSARLDGCTGLKRVVYIDLPLILGQIRLLTIWGIIGGIQGFGAQLILTNGGPGYATMVPGLYMYNTAFTWGMMGYGSAIGVAMFVAILALTAINMKVLRPSMEYGAK